MRFCLTRDPIPDLTALDGNDSGGAVASFVGRVRNVNEGQSVSSLEYEAFDELAQHEGERIVEEAIERFGLIDAICVHRIGHLQIGEDAIRVEAMAGHRRHAFEGCQWIVDEVKARVPIWKKEHYESGSTEWLQPEPMGPRQDL